MVGAGWSLTPLLAGRSENAGGSHVQVPAGGFPGGGDGPQGGCLGPAAVVGERAPGAERAATRRRGRDRWARRVGPGSTFLAGKTPDGTFLAGKTPDGTFLAGKTPDG